MSHPYREPAVMEAGPNERWNVTWWKRIVVRFARATGENYVWRMQRSLDRIRRSNDMQIVRIEQMRMDRIYDKARLRKVEELVNMVLK